jgi:small neutral amino acid transporter SnatA (MarC family)
VKQLARRVSSIAWPAFLMAGVLEIVVFAFVDPGSLRWFGGAALDLGATTVYSLAFFAFWVVIAAAGVMMQRLGETEVEVNSRTFR